ncbi:MAG: hypothetical protein GX949_07640 [Peptococcaceae bacterium]|jgi:hypothetical protein|nr:hypothetical protein [Peptococcaceae bacterium]
MVRPQLKPAIGALPAAFARRYVPTAPFLSRKKEKPLLTTARRFILYKGNLFIEAVIKVAVATSDCIICHKGQAQHARGLQIKGHYICRECEQRIVFLNGDDPVYAYYKWGLKKLWYWPVGS